MIRFIVIVLGMLLCTVQSFSQAQWPPVYELKTDTITVLQLDSTYWQTLEDNEGEWTLADVSKEPLSNRFHRNGGTREGTQPMNSSTQWLRYRMKNVMNHEARISLIALVDYLDIYIEKKNSEVKRYKTGFLRKWEEKDGLKSVDYSGAIPLVLASGEEITIYERRNMRDREISGTAVEIRSTEKLVQLQYIEYTDERVFIYNAMTLQEAFMIGMLFISILISGFFFRAVREKVYLYFALFAFFLAINRHFNIASAYTTWFLQDWVKYVNLLGLCWAFIPFFLVQFIRHFYGVKSRFPRWDVFLFGSGLLSFFLMILPSVLRLIDIKQMPTWFTYSGSFLVFVIVPFFIVITALLFINKRNRSYTIISYAVLPLMILYIVAFPCFYDFGWGTPRGVFADFLKANYRFVEMILLCWLIICFVRVLISRFDALRLENARQALDKERLMREREMERAQLIEQQKMVLEAQVMERTAELNQSLENLKSAQGQLLQSEKMASLGELTAGIAHEIQNPLNFVNNFSELNSELIDEMNAELDKGNVIEAKDIAVDVKQNLEKISYHGRRADAIVKGMLMHSRVSTGHKEPTNINALCEEYLRLAYHGQRAKDSTINPKLEVQFDDSLPAIEVVPQDMGRVLLNLINNALYAVSERTKKEPANYEPTITVITRKEANHLVIVVQDNGAGIPDSIKGKIYQPFFTTKPTGQGTGLGLSLAYDIVKAHGGKLNVETTEGEGSRFIIELPITQQ